MTATSFLMSQNTEFDESSQARRSYGGTMRRAARCRNPDSFCSRWRGYLLLRRPVRHLHRMLATRPTAWSWPHRVAYDAQFRAVDHPPAARIRTGWRPVRCATAIRSTSVSIPTTSSWNWRPSTLDQLPTRSGGRSTPALRAKRHSVRRAFRTTGSRSSGSRPTTCPSTSSSRASSPHRSRRVDTRVTLTHGTGFCRE